MSILASDELRMNQAALLSEVLDARKKIVGTLAADDLGDADGDELAVLAATGMSPEDPMTLMRSLGMTEGTFSQVTAGLLSREFLRRRDNPHGTGRITVLSERGLAIVVQIEKCVKNARWADFQFRQGDIVISTFPKSGTTWAQMICALLIFQNPELPAPLQVLSPDMENLASNRGKISTVLAAQDHRRFIKSHLSLDELPVSPQATYVVIARHPLDIAVSLYRIQAAMDGRAKDTGAGASPGPGAGERLLRWIDRDSLPGQRATCLSQVIEHISAGWARRDEPNVELIHYEDLAAGLEDNMRGLAARLAITVPEKRWPALVRAATFDQMRADAGRLQPQTELVDNPAAFFRSGTSGSGRALLTSAELDHYYDRAAQLAPAELLDWLHRENPSRPA